MNVVHEQIRAAGEWLAVSRAASVIAWPVETDEAHCPECGNYLDEMSIDGRDQHMVREGRVYIGCEGFYLPALIIGYEFYARYAAIQFRFCDGDRVATSHDLFGTVDGDHAVGAESIAVVWDSDDSEHSGYEDDVYRDLIRHVMDVRPD